jgi:hypothetical protein
MLKYIIIQLAERTTCSTCHNKIDLLCHESMKPGAAAFLICWNCRTIDQVGVGPVKRE